MYARDEFPSREHIFLLKWRPNSVNSHLSQTYPKFKKIFYVKLFRPGKIRVSPDNWPLWKKLKFSIIPLKINWMSFPEIGLVHHPKNLKYRKIPVIEWVCQNLPISVKLSCKSSTKTRSWKWVSNLTFQLHEYHTDSYHTMSHMQIPTIRRTFTKFPPLFNLTVLNFS